MKKVFKQYFLTLFYIVWFIIFVIVLLGIIHGDLNVSNIIVKNEKIHAVIDLGDVTYSFTIFDFTIALCYLILFVFEDDNAKLSDVHIKSFVDAYEKKYKRFNDSELSIIHVSCNFIELYIFVQF